MRTLLVVGLAGTLLAGPLVGQTGGMGGMHQGQGMGMQGQGMGMGMMVPGPLRKFMAFAPAKLLEMKGMLELSGDQESRLTALQETAKKQSEDAHAPAHAAMQSLQKELAAGSPDMDAVKGYFMAHNTAMGNTQWIEVSTALQAMAVLTDGQRKHVEEMASHQGGMGGMNHGAPPNRP